MHASACRNKIGAAAGLVICSDFIIFSGVISPVVEFLMSQRSGGHFRREPSGRARWTDGGASGDSTLRIMRFSSASGSNSPCGSSTAIGAVGDAGLIVPLKIMRSSHAHISGQPGGVVENAIDAGAANLEPLGDLGRPEPFSLERGDSFRLD